MSAIEQFLCISALPQCLLTVLFSTTVELYAMLKSLVFVGTIFHILVMVGMLHQRWKQPHLKRPVKVHYGDAVDE